MGWGLFIQRRSHFPKRGGWPECSGMGGRNQSESPAGMDRNRWLESIGISGRNASEYALDTYEREIERSAGQFRPVSKKKARRIEGILQRAKKSKNGKQLYRGRGSRSP